MNLKTFNASGTLTITRSRVTGYAFAVHEAGAATSVIDEEASFPMLEYGEIRSVMLLATIGGEQLKINHMEIGGEQTESVSKAPDFARAARALFVKLEDKCK